MLNHENHWVGQRFYRNRGGVLVAEVGNVGAAALGDYAYWHFREDFRRGFQAAAASTVGWHLDQVEVGSTVEAAIDPDEPYQAITYGSGATADDNVHYQWGENTTVIEPVTMAAGKRLCVTTRFKISDVSANLFMSGCHEAADDPWGTEPNDQFLIRTSAGKVRFSGSTVNTAIQTTTGFDMTDATYVTAQAFYDGASTVQFRAWGDDGAELGAAEYLEFASYVPATPMTIAHGVEGSDTGNDTVTLDFLDIWADRYTGAL